MGTPKSRIIIFCFAGRKENLELQLPLIEDILERHPTAEYHAWNLALNKADSDYIRTLGKRHKRIKVINDYYGVDPWKHFDDVYRHYAQRRYSQSTFVKIDEDVVFLESRRFGSFLEAIESSPHAIISAQVFNNGACTSMEPGLWSAYRAHPMLGVRNLLDVHKKPVYAQLCHDYFLDNFHRIVQMGSPTLHSTQDWLSINLIGMDYQMMVKFAGLLKTPSPRRIAGRLFGPRATLGDEGLVNTLPRLVLRGFTAAHLYFGPQRKLLSDDQVNAWRARYLLRGQEYLGA